MGLIYSVAVLPLSKLYTKKVRYNFRKLRNRREITYKNYENPLVPKNVYTSS